MITNSPLFFFLFNQIFWINKSFLPLNCNLIDGKSLAGYMGPELWRRVDFGLYVGSKEWKILLAREIFLLKNKNLKHSLIFSISIESLGVKKFSSQKLSKRRLKTFSKKYVQGRTIFQIFIFLNREISNKQNVLFFRPPYWDSFKIQQKTDRFALDAQNWILKTGSARTQMLQVGCKLQSVTMILWL